MQVQVCRCAGGQVCRCTCVQVSRCAGAGTHLPLAGAAGAVGGGHGGGARLRVPRDQPVLRGAAHTRYTITTLHHYTITPLHYYTITTLQRYTITPRHGKSGEVLGKITAQIANFVFFSRVTKEKSNLIYPYIIDFFLLILHCFGGNAPFP